MANKYVYLFSEGNANMRELLGGKGANLAEMTNIGLPVPQGFTITTEACTQYYEDGEKINDEIQAQIMEYVGKLEEITGKKFGDKENPLLVSVRSGARASMPGMMDTILNLGLNEDVVKVLAEKSGNPRWAYDCYRRFIQMYSDVVMEVGKKYFEELIDKMKAERGVTQDVELTADDLKELAEQFKAEYKEKVGAEFPTDPVDQLGSLSLWVSLPLTCLLGPLVEELCFRRALLERLRPWGDGFALCASALLFALFHGNLFQSLYTLSIGLLLGGVALYTGQLRWAVGLHAAFNFLSAGLVPLAVALGSVGDLAFTAVVILSMAWTLHWLVYRGEALAKAARALRWGDGETWGHFLVNPGMTVFLLAILALTWYNLR